VNSDPTPEPGRFDYGDGTLSPSGRRIVCPHCGHDQDIGARLTVYRADQSAPPDDYYADAGESIGDLRCSATPPPARVRTDFRGDHCLAEFDCFNCRKGWRHWIALHKGGVAFGGMLPAVQAADIGKAAIADLAESIQQLAEEIAAWVGRDNGGQP
jgi:hypothetical protein